MVVYPPYRKENRPPCNLLTQQYMEHDEQHTVLLGLAIIAYKYDDFMDALIDYANVKNLTSWYKYYADKKNEGISIEIVDKTLYITIEIPASLKNP